MSPLQFERPPLLKGLWGLKLYTLSHTCRKKMVKCDVYEMKTVSHLKNLIQTSTYRALDTKQIEDLHLKNA